MLPDPWHHHLKKPEGGTLRLHTGAGERTPVMGWVGSAAAVPSDSLAHFLLSGVLFLVFVFIFFLLTVFRCALVLVLVVVSTIVIFKTAV